jgi:hypothetical protein
MNRWKVIPLLLLLSNSGCQQKDQQIAEMTERLITEQSHQNQLVSEAHGNLAEGSKLLVEADANARRELAQIQGKVREDLAVIAQRQDILEAERKAIAMERRQESLVTSSLLTFGILLACLAPLVLAGFALLTLNRTPVDDEQAEILLTELAQVLSESSPINLPPAGDSLHLPPPAERR